MKPAGLLSAFECPSPASPKHITPPRIPLVKGRRGLQGDSAEPSGGIGFYPSPEKKRGAREGADLTDLRKQLSKYAQFLGRFVLKNVRACLAANLTFSFVSFHGNKLTCAFGAKCTISMATV